MDDGTLTFASLLAMDKVIEIPIIQRDYVQGRKEVEEVRSQFLAAIYKALSKPVEDLVEPLDLDFVYGSLQGDEKETFWPLDGQQRLTTLFLLHWYLANRDGEIDAFRSMVLRNNRPRFTYQTRRSSGLFFNELAKMDVDLDEMQGSDPGSPVLSKVIKNSKWFFVSLGYDPTVQSALTMLNSIHKHFFQSRGFYQRLTGNDKPYITFQFLNLDEFGLSDDLYIKMNARGKPLSAFENFKAKFEQTVGILCKGQTMNLHGSSMPVKEYLSRKIDTEWADLFWGFCGADTEKNDDQQMQFFRSLIGVLIPISFGKDDIAKVRDVLSAIRDDRFEPSHFKYVELECFSQALILNIIALMNQLVSESGGFKKRLKDAAYYDEQAVFVIALEKLVTRGREPKGLTYQPAIQFFAWCLYLIHHKDACNSEALYQWIRLVHNLVANSRIDDVRTYTDTLFSLIDLVDEADDVLGYLSGVDEKFRLQGFYRPQIREERIKAQLILRSEDWRTLVYKAEQHPYFKGQIEFLLDFSGILDYFSEHGCCDWSDAEDVIYQELFLVYLDKSTAVFGRDGVRIPDDYLFERALLAKGDYLIKSGSNHSFLKNGHDRDISWKRLLRGSESQNDENKTSFKRKYVKSLLDDLNISDVKSSLVGIAANPDDIDEWRKMVVEYPEIVKCCEKTFVRRNMNDETIYLMKRSQTNGAHLELRSYHLYLSKLRHKPKRELYRMALTLGLTY
ncbi:MAG: DUF262 domain-containing protein [Gammaproteobacteria bacterium]|nr:DUF262 domain-containing protein [Gammaproteobacteria bacterium]